MRSMNSEKLFLKLKVTILTIMMIVVTPSAFTVQSVEENTSGYNHNDEEPVWDFTCRTYGLI